MAEERFESGPIIDKAFSINGDLAIKQEPEEVMDKETEEELDTCTQQAASQSLYINTDEDKIKELFLYYQVKFQLKDVQVELQKCDKIWETLQIIKNLQNSFHHENISCSIEPETQHEDSSDFSPLQISQEPPSDNNFQTHPNFRFPVKCKKRLYYCVTCGKEYSDKKDLIQHAMDDHKIVNPQKIYNARESTKMNFTEDNKLDSEIENKNLEATISPKWQHEESDYSNEYFNSISDNLNSNSELEKPLVKATKSSSKEKIKCILCKRITVNIVNHLKGYHKVKSYMSIVNQCHKITDDTTSYDSSKKIKENNEFLTKKININSFLGNSTRKRKLETTHDTTKKRFKSLKNIVNMPDKKFECDICFGTYKSRISFMFHKKTHQLRGETPENFDPSKCRFLNSPLRFSNKANNKIHKSINNVPTQNESTINCQSTVNYSSQENLITDSSISNEGSNTSQNINKEMICNSQIDQQISKCECGRSFRNYYTLFLHKSKCKRFESSYKSHCKSINNDTDSGIGISIKIKKNKNDSYEVVPKINFSNGKFKEMKSSKDSDASSNDSGVVSVDYSNSKINHPKTSKDIKSHSILRIQAAEDDEEIDIEDSDDSDSNFNENCGAYSLDDQDSTSRTSFCSTENKNLIESNISEESSIKTLSITKNNFMPSLTNLCRQVISHQDIEQFKYKCHECFICFNSASDLKHHASQMNHNLISNCSCGKQFKNFKFFNTHVKRFHPLLLNCNYCKSNFDKIEKYLQHKCNVLEGKEFIEPILQTQCNICKSFIDIGDQFDKHMKTHNVDLITFQCFKCFKKFDNVDMRRLHFNKEHAFSLCRICGKVLHVDQLSTHEAYHDGLGHPCHKCKKAFTQKTFLKKHVQNAHDAPVNEAVNCFICLKQIKLKYLKKHTSLHMHKEICKKCDKCFPDVDKKLNNHVILKDSNDANKLKNRLSIDSSDFKKECNN